MYVPQKCGIDIRIRSYLIKHRTENRIKIGTIPTGRALNFKQYFAKAERHDFFCKLILFELMSKEFSGTIITKG